MNKKPVLFLLIFTIFSSVVYADWMAEISSYLSKEKDYRGAVEYLLNRYESFNNLDKAFGCGLLAYSYNRMNDKDHEYEWLGKFFETYRGFNPGFYFLDIQTSAAITEYITTWQGKYPLVAEIGFVYRETSQSPDPPAELIIGLKIANRAFYKLLDGKKTIKAGQFNRGFNSFKISTQNLFEEPHSARYSLELKADDLIVQKEITIDIKLDTPVNLKKSGKKLHTREYKVSMFAGDKLLASSKKTSQDFIPIKFELPPQKDRSSPYGPVHPSGKTDPSSSSVSIPGAIAAIYNLIKGLTKGEELEPVPPVELQQNITLTFMRKNSQGVEEEVKARVAIQKRNKKFFSFT